MKNDKPLMVIVMSPDMKGGIKTFCETIIEGLHQNNHKTIYCTSFFKSLYCWVLYWENVIFITNLSYGIFGLLKKKSIYILHGYPRYDISGFFKFYKVLIGHKLGTQINCKTISVSRLVQIVNIHYFGNNTDEVIYNPLSNNFIKYNIGPLNKEKIISYIGRIEKEKNIENIIKGFLKSNALKNGYSLFICGNGNQLNYLNNKYKNSNIHFTGYLKKYEVISLLKKSKIFISLSDFEPFGISLTEAASLNNFLITTNTTGALEVFNENIYKIINPSDLNKISSSINFYLNKNFNESSIFTEDITSSSIAAKYIKIFNEEKINNR